MLKSLGRERSDGPSRRENDLGGPDTLVGDEPSVRSRGPECTFEEGAAVGRYVLLERVGAGGMGVVYAAYDPQLDRRIALKVLKGRGFRRTLGSDGPTRLLREAQAMAKLSHPNVVALHDVGTLGDEVFLAMEFIEGQSLRVWLHGEHHWRDIVDVFLQAGRGLAAAHAAGLVHRDFKPDNVLVGDNGRVVVTDFGLARQLQVSDATLSEHLGPEVTQPQQVIPEEEEDEGSSAQLIVSGAMSRTAGQVGTPAYMAPEQHETMAEVTAAADQFSFCVALYEALFGRHPFRGSDPVSISMAVVANDRRPPRPDEHRVPRRIRRVIERGLSHDPKQRFAAMRALLAQLNPRSPAQRNAKWAFVGMAGLLGVTGASVWMTDSSPTACANASRHLESVWNRAERQRIADAFEASGLPFSDRAMESVSRRLDEYATQWVGTHKGVCEASVHGEQSQELLDRRMRCLDRRRDALIQLVGVLAEADTETVLRAQSTAEALPGIEGCNDLEALQAGYALPPTEKEAILAEASALRLRAETLLEAGKLEEGHASANAAFDLAMTTGYPPIIARTRQTLTHSTSRRGKFAQAERLATQTLVDARAAKDVRLEAEAWLDRLMIVGLHQRRPDEAERFTPLVRAAILQVAEPAPLLGQLERIRGLIAAARGHHSVAAEHFSSSLNYFESGPEAHPPEVALATARLATALTRSRSNEAAATCSTASKRLQQAFGPTHPETLHVARVCAQGELKD